MPTTARRESMAMAELEGGQSWHCFGVLEIAKQIREGDERVVTIVTSPALRPSAEVAVAFREGKARWAAVHDDLLPVHVFRR